MANDSTPQGDVRDIQSDIAHRYRRNTFFLAIGIITVRLVPGLELSPEGVPIVGVENANLMWLIGYWVLFYNALMLGVYGWIDSKTFNVKYEHLHGGHPTVLFFDNQIRKTVKKKGPDRCLVSCKWG